MVFHPIFIFVIIVAENVSRINLVLVLYMGYHKFMTKNALMLTDSLDPWHNLALEEQLFDTHKGGVLLYLWQNQDTVVIGRNQNAWKECRMQALEEDGGRLARRTSGGGAVFHDTGNLNFSFIADKSLYDQQRQLALILQAVESLGIRASFTGRNDIVTDSGAKFSGSAFRHFQNVSLHHGTILLSADMHKLSKYLAPSTEKLRSKGVESVRARVCNLCEYRPELTPAMMKAALIDAFAQSYGAYERIYEEELDRDAFDALCKRHASWEWRCGASPRFDAAFSHRFAWGELELQLCLKNGLIQSAAAFSDAMDEAFIRSIPPALTGLRFDGETLIAALRALGGSMAEDIAQYLGECF